MPFNATGAGGNKVVPMYGGGQVPNPANVKLVTSAPSTSNVDSSIGTLAIIPSSGAAYLCVKNTGVTVTWEQLGLSTGSVGSLTGTSGGAVTPTAGNINILGTANQIVFTGSGSTLTASFSGPYTPATFTAHGVLVGESTSSIAALAAGTTGQVLIGSTGADPAFGAIGVNSGLTVHGVLLAENNSAFVATAAGTTGQVLTGVTGADPTWANLPTFNIVDNTSGTVGSPTAATVNTKYIADQASVVTGFLLPASATLGQTITILGNGPGGWQIQQNANQAIKLNAQTTTTGTGGSLSSTNRYNAVTLQCIVAGASTIWNAAEVSGSLTFV